jgi:hypothetical protein
METLLHSTVFVYGMHRDCSVFTFTCTVEKCSWLRNYTIPNFLFDTSKTALILHNISFQILFIYLFEIYYHLEIAQRFLFRTYDVRFVCSYIMLNSSDAFSASFLRFSLFCRIMTSLSVFHRAFQLSNVIYFYILSNKIYFSICIKCPKTYNFPHYTLYYANSTYFDISY